MRSGLPEVPALLPPVRGAPPASRLAGRAAGRARRLQEDSGALGASFLAPETSTILVDRVRDPRRAGRGRGPRAGLVSSVDAIDSTRHDETVGSSGRGPFDRRVATASAPGTGAGPNFAGGAACTARDCERAAHGDPPGAGTNAPASVQGARQGRRKAERSPTACGGQSAAGPTVKPGRDAADALHRSNRSRRPSRDCRGAGDPACAGRIRHRSARTAVVGAHRRGSTRRLGSSPAADRANVPAVAGQHPPREPCLGGAAPGGRPGGRHAPCPAAQGHLVARHLRRDDRASGRRARAIGRSRPRGRDA
jgi:hypothetical protein